MKKTILIAILMLLLSLSIESKKFSWGRSSNSRRTSYKPAPTSAGHAQSSILKPSQTSVQKSSLSGWQEKPKQTAANTRPSQTHSYPSSQTGLSGKSPPARENVQPNNQQNTNSKPQNHGYPASPGSSGNSKASYPQQQNGGLSGAGGPPPYSGSNSPSQGSQSQNHGYPASHGLSGSGTNYPQQQSSGLNKAVPLPYPGHPSQGGYNSAGSVPGNNYHASNYHHPQGPPPPYSHNYGGYGSYGPGPQQPGYFGNYGNRGFGGGMSRSGSALTGVGIAGAGIGTVLTGLALWNLARSTGRHHHTVIYDNRGQPVAVAPSNETAEAVDPMLADLVNCTLTIAGVNATEVLAIPCSIATSFSPDAEVQDLSVGNTTDNTKCTITVVTKAGKEFMTTIPCSVLLNTAAENNVTEPPIVNNESDVFEPNTSNGVPNISEDLTVSKQQQNFSSTLNCTIEPEPGVDRDPINPCFSIDTNITVVPINLTSISNVSSTPPIA